MWRVHRRFNERCRSSNRNEDSLCGGDVASKIHAKQDSENDYRVRHVIGIATCDLFVARTGEIRGQQRTADS
jgi:hypothetical protein